MALASLDRLKRQNKALLVACLATVLLALGNWLVVRQIRTRFAETNAEIRASIEQIRGYHEILARRDQYEKEYETIQQYVQLATPDRRPDAEMLTDLGKMAEACGVSVLERQSRGFTKKQFVEEHAVLVVLEGSMVDLSRFLYRVESSPQLLRVAKIDIGPSARKKNTLVKSTLLINKLVSVRN